MEEQLNMKRKSRPSRKKEYAILEEMEAQEAKKKRKLNYGKNCTSNEQSALEAEKVQTSKRRRKELDQKRYDGNQVKSRKITDVRAHDVLGETKRRAAKYAIEPRERCMRYNVKNHHLKEYKHLREEEKNWIKRDTTKMKLNREK
jgi:hypothetical protein